MLLSEVNFQKSRTKIWESDDEGSLTRRRNIWMALNQGVQVILKMKSRNLRKKNLGNLGILGKI